ncbi:unnamed protein product [Penicillium bialowiezense]
MLTASSKAPDAEVALWDHYMLALRRQQTDERLPSQIPSSREPGLILRREEAFGVGGSILGSLHAGATASADGRETIIPDRGSPLAWAHSTRYRQVSSPSESSQWLAAIHIHDTNRIPLSQQFPIQARFRPPLR